MKVVVTADIHFGVGNNKHIVKNLSKRIIKTKADAKGISTQKLDKSQKRGFNSRRCGFIEKVVKYSQDVQ